MSEQESGKVKNYYARTAWALFLVSLALFIAAQNIFNLPGDVSGMICILLFFLVVVSVVILDLGNSLEWNVNWKITSHIYSMVICPLLLVVTVVSFFVAWPLSDAEIMYPRGQPLSDAAMEVKGFTFYSPFNNEVAEYELTGYVVYDSVSVIYEYTGTALDFHHTYGENRAQQYRDRVNTTVIQAIEEFKRTQSGVPRFKLLCWLDSELPGRLPSDVKYTGQLGLSGNTTVWGPVGIKDE